MTSPNVGADDTINVLKDTLLGMIYEGDSVGLALIDLNGTIRATDPDFKKILSISQERKIIGADMVEVFDVLGMSDLETGEKIDPKSAPDSIRKTLQSGDTYASQLIARTMDGRNVHMNSWFDGKGNLLIVVRDISDDVRQRRLLEMAMEAGNAGYWSLNYLTGKYTYSRSLLNRLTDAERAKIQEHGLFSIIHRDDMTEIVRSWQEIMNGERPFDIKYRVVLENEGTIWQQSLGQLEHSADGSLVGVTAFNRDITKEVAQQQDLKEAERVSNAKSEFLARMSHEIRTPLNAIIGLSDSLHEEELSEEVRDVVKDIEEAAEGLHELLTKTLDHAKLLSSKVELSPIKEDPRNIINACAKLWRPQCTNKNLQFNIHIAPNTPGLMLLDGFRIQQCLNNLLSNAIKFTDKGSINLHLKPVDIQGKEHVVFAVTDTGIGMSESQTNDIFAPFTQADDSISRKYGGTGLGTSIAKQLTELMGGSLRVKSVQGKGSTFALILPNLETREKPQSIRPEAVKPDENRAPENRLIEMTSAMNIADPEGRVPPPSAFAGLSVLCVEDNAVNQRVVKRLIGKKVTALHFADNGREAIDALQREDVDVVLMDIHMPVMNGIEATMEIRESGKPWANVAIIALTADPDYQQKDICRQIGMNGTIAKPVKRQDIIDAFDQVLKNQWQKAG